MRRAIFQITREGARLFGKTDYTVPSYWYLELCTAAGDMSTPGTPVSASNWVRTRILNVSTMWTGTNPVVNVRRVVTRRLNQEEVIEGVELWDAQSSGNRCFIGELYDDETDALLTSLTIPSGKGFLIDPGEFEYYER